MAKKDEIDTLQEIIAKSEDDFEKKITYITAGALLLSLTFLEKIVSLDNTTGNYYLIFCWLFLILSLLANLISHLISKAQLRKAQQEINDNIPLEKRQVNYKKRIIVTEGLNWSSCSLLILGIACILIFASLNVIHPKSINTIPTNDTVKVQIIF